MASTIPWTQIRALSFDIYGTLIDWENGIASTARATALGPYLPSSHEKLMHDIERHDTAVQKENPTWPQTAIIAEGLRRYAAELDVTGPGNLSSEQLDEAIATYSRGIGSYPAFADTVAAMKRLGERFKLVPLSNVDNESFAESREKALKGVTFDAIYTAQDIGSYKPALRNFEYLLQHLDLDFGVKKEQLVHVAQSRFHDHLPAKQMGLYGVWVDRKGLMGNMGGAGIGEEQSQEYFGYRFKVESLKELADLIDEAIAKEGK